MVLEDHGQSPPRGSGSSSFRSNGGAHTHAHAPARAHAGAGAGAGCGGIGVGFGRLLLLVGRGLLRGVSSEYEIRKLTLARLAKMFRSKPAVDGVKVRVLVAVFAGESEEEDAVCLEVAGDERGEDGRKAQLVLVEEAEEVPEEAAAAEAARRHKRRRKEGKENRELHVDPYLVPDDSLCSAPPSAALAAATVRDAGRLRAEGRPLPPDGSIPAAPSSSGMVLRVRYLERDWLDEDCAVEATALWEGRQPEEAIDAVDGFKAPPPPPELKPLGTEEIMGELSEDHFARNSNDEEKEQEEEIALDQSSIPAPWPEDGEKSILEQASWLD